MNSQLFGGIVLISILVYPLTMRSNPDTLCQCDLSRYDIEHFDRSLSKSQRLGALDAEVRSFLWNHWHKQQLGLAIVTSYSVEGDRKKMVFMIDPDKQGAWRIRYYQVEEVKSSNSTAHVERKEFQIYSLDRIENQNMGAKSIDASTTVPGTSYRLLFRDEKGTSIGEW